MRHCILSILFILQAIRAHGETSGVQPAQTKIANDLFGKISVAAGKLNSQDGSKPNVIKFKSKEEVDKFLRYLEKAQNAIGVSKSPQNNEIVKVVVIKKENIRPVKNSPLQIDASTGANKNPPRLAPNFFEERKVQVPQVQHINVAKVQDIDRQSANRHFGKDNLHSENTEPVKQLELPAEDQTETDEYIIAWEMGPAYDFLKANGDLDKYGKLEDYVMKANAWIKKYVRIKKGVLPIVKPDMLGMYCNRKVSPNQIYKAHILLIVEVHDLDSEGDENTLAFGMSCDAFEGERVTVGKLVINNRRFFRNLNPVVELRRVTTIIHESFHAIAFNKEHQDEFFNTPVDEKHKFLKEMQGAIKKSNTQLYLDGHWNEIYIFNDLMIAFDRDGTLFSVFSAELLEHTNSQMVVNKSIMPNNFLWDRVQNRESLFNYVCDARDENPPSDMYCGAKETSSYSTCSKDFRFKMRCPSLNAKVKCRIKIPLSEGNCQAERPSPNEYESFGRDSRCFESYSAVLGQNVGARCLKYMYKFDSDVRVLYIGNDDAYKPCTYSGEIVDFINPSGTMKMSVKCPDLDDFSYVDEKTRCPYDCYNRGVCINKSCSCTGNYDENTHCRTEKSVNKTSFVVVKNFEMRPLDSEDDISQN